MVCTSAVYFMSSVGASFARDRRSRFGEISIALGFTIALTIGSSLAFVIYSVDRSLHRANPKLISFPHLTLKSRIYLHPYTYYPHKMASYSRAPILAACGALVGKARFANRSSGM